MYESLVRMLAIAPANGVPDAELVRRVAAGEDDTAFELLVRRYAEAVWRTCRSVAGEHHAAEDAFQAAFLALARKASAIRGPVGGWLYRVAYHASLKTRNERRRLRPPPKDFAPSSGGEEPRRSSDDFVALHAELNRLPDKYRTPILLCHLHGRTQAQAAVELGLPVGTVATRVRRGLDRLKIALVRRGVTAGIGLLVADVLVPPKLIAAAASRAVPAAAISSLATGALSAMKPMPWKLPAAVLVAACGGGLMFAQNQGGGGKTPPAPPPAVPVAAPKPTVSTYFQRQHTEENLKKLGIAFHAHHDAREHMPQDIKDADGKPLLSWRVAILPHLDQNFLYESFKQNEPWDSEHNKKLLRHMPAVFGTLGHGGPETYMKRFRGATTAFDPVKPVPFISITDGLSNTLMVVEAGPAVPWTKPADLDYDPKKPLPEMTGPFADRIHTVFGDGSVRPLRWNLEERTYRNLIEKADGMVIVTENEPLTTKPATKEEKLQIARIKGYIADREQYYNKLLGERDRLVGELQRTGGIPPLDPIPDDASVEQWMAEQDRFVKREQALSEEIIRLYAAVEKRKKK